MVVDTSAVLRRGERPREWTWGEALTGTQSIRHQTVLGNIAWVVTHISRQALSGALPPALMFKIGLFAPAHRANACPARRRAAPGAGLRMAATVQPITLAAGGHSHNCPLFQTKARLKML
jgi:hypothetical protein